ncbi:ABC transporter G family member 20-like [Papaver somniferum]|nr:ABC transporter G family member 20-like [Papaver somniferum]
MSQNEDLEQQNKTISTPFVLQFNNLTYSINIRKEITIRRMLCRKDTGTIDTLSRKKVLLNDISGEAREGEIFAILGPSGSGKTTLIDALANKISKKSLRGSVTLNGETLESAVLKSISAYVMQDDLLFPMLTVEETLMFSAEFRLPRSVSKSKKMARVQTVIEELGLRDAAKTLIGDEGHRGISGGERRRVSIGVGIIHDPILMLLDEPTSGLDSSSAFMVVKILQQIARTGRIVIMSVHQPSSRVVGLFDHLIFLSQGETVYYGTPTHLSVFLSEFGHPVTENGETTEFMLDLYSNLEGLPGGTKSIVEFNKSWQTIRNHPYTSKHSNGLDLPSLKEAIYNTCANGSGRTWTSSKFANSFWVEIIVLMKRSLINSKRSAEIFLVRVAGVVASGFILASTFWHPDKTERGIVERLGFFVFIVTIIFFGNTDWLGVFVQERYIFMRETAYNAYRRSSYILYHSIIVIPTLIVLSLILASITFPAVSLDGGFLSFLFYFLAICASGWAANSLICLISGLFFQVVVGYTVAMTLVGLFLLYSGFYMNRDRIPSYWIWFHYMSPMKYPFQALVLNEFDKPNLCVAKVGAEPAMSCVMTGLDIIRKLDAIDLSKWSCLWITLAFGVIYRILFYFALSFGSKNKRK